MNYGHESWLAVSDSSRLVAQSLQLLNNASKKHGIEIIS